jgi:hypothetical protein
VDLKDWIEADLQALTGRIANGVVAHVPRERWRERPGGGAQPGSSIAWLLLHMGYHHDLAVRTAVQEREPYLHAWRDGLGLEAMEPEAGLSEAEDPAVTAAVDVDVLLDYVLAVVAGTREWLTRVNTHAFDTVPAASWRLEHTAGVRPEVVPWLHAMWDGKPVSWFVQWEAVGHGINHVGEMIGVRGQLGLSPF